jgi:hypothetical protein
MTGDSSARGKVRSDLGHFLVEGGAVVGGGAAFGATIGLVAGSILHDLRREVDPELWARKGAVYGGVFAMVVLVLEG